MSCQSIRWPHEPASARTALSNVWIDSFLEFYKVAFFRRGSWSKIKDRVRGFQGVFDHALLLPDVVPANAKSGGAARKPQ